MSTEQHSTLSADLDAIQDATQRSDLPVVVVTGASGGIGSRIALDLSRDRLVVAVGRRRERLEELAARAQQGPRRPEAAPGAILPLVADLTDLEGIDAVFSRLPRADALVHAAAIAPRATVADAGIAHWRDMLETNVMAPAELTRVLLPLLREAAAPVEADALPGTVVFLGSGASRAVNPYNVAYAASKHAVQALADGLRQETAQTGLRVTTVAPGPVDTPMVQWDDDYPKAAPARLIEPETVARSVRHVLDAPADTQLTEVWVRPRVEAK
ncbi:short chain dehydrogenase [Mycobacteroides abscessus subsp. abscessus]|nr:short chain dehydrogenase [Mycobacteroides abscessus subsp. abscessus]